jgi:hypothetical protein
MLDLQSVVALLEFSDNQEDLVLAQVREAFNGAFVVNDPYLLKQITQELIIKTFLKENIGEISDLFINKAI